METKLSNIEDMLLNRDATLALFKPRYFGGDLIAVFTQSEDENLIGIMRHCDGWQYQIRNNPWYPMFIGRNAFELIEKVKTHVNSVPEEHMIDWLAACHTLENGITAAGWTDYSYPDQAFDVSFPNWELPYGYTREWVEATYIEVALEVLTPNGTPVAKLSTEEMAEEVKSSKDDIDRFMTLHLEGQESKEEVRDKLRDFIENYERNR